MQAANVIYSLSKMRYKQGKGDSSGFKLFMKKENVSPGLIVRYVSNRLHVIFHLAGVFFFLRDLLQLHLDKYSRNTTSLRTALQKNLRNEVIMMQLRCLGLMGKFLTGPWMQGRQSGFKSGGTGDQFIYTYMYVYTIYIYIYI